MKVELRATKGSSAPGSVAGVALSSRAAGGAEHRGASGDRSGVVMRPDGTTVAWLFDATGHGPAAARDADAIEGVLRALPGWPSGSAEDAMMQADAALSAAGLFTTMQIVCLERAPPRLSVASAGFPNVLVVPGNGDAPRVLDAGGLYVGDGYARYPHDGAQARLAPGDLVVLTSDGITEARDATGGMFGADGVATLVTAHQRKHPEAIAAALMAAVTTHARDTGIEDDQSVVVLRVPGGR